MDSDGQRWTNAAHPKEKAENKRGVELIGVFCFVFEHNLKRNIKLIFALFFTR
jgi:hypothetical protein